MSFDSNKAYLELYNAIKTDKRPADLLYQFLSSGDVKANYLSNQILQNKTLIQLITSPQGRAWIRKHLDGTLDYIAKVAGC